MIDGLISLVVVLMALGMYAMGAYVLAAQEAKSLDRNGCYGPAALGIDPDGDMKPIHVDRRGFCRCSGE